MIINKVTVGYVTQRFDTKTQKFIGQEFTAADEVTWEDQGGEHVDSPGDVAEPYLNYEMIQPSTSLFQPGDRVLVKPDNGDSEYHGTVLTCDSLLVQVNDVSGQCSVCNFNEVTLIK